MNKDGFESAQRIDHGISGRTTGTGRVLAGASLLLAAGSAGAAVPDESQFVLNTFSFLIWGALVMWMCAGFTMLESGSVRTKNASVICLKNIGLYSIAGLAYYFIGYNLMYVDVSGWIGSFKLLYGPSADELALLAGQEEAKAAVVESGYSTMSDWFFQMVFVATAASIVSGTLAERVKLWSFFAFITVLTAVIYPIVGAWTWGEGWLYEMGFQDFAGSTIVHSTGGWAALAGAMVVGARRGKFRADGSVKSTPPSNVPVVTLGVFILWLGWFGFNGGSQLALGGAVDAIAMSNVLVNTNLAAAAGVIAAISVSRPFLGRVDLLAGLNGAIAGLVAITAGPDIVDHYWAVIIGAIGAILCTAGIKVMEAMKLRRRGRGSRSSHRRGLGHARSLHSGRGEHRHPTRRGARGGCIRVRSLVDSVAGAREDDRGAGLGDSRRARPGHGRARDRILSRVHDHAGPGRHRRTPTRLIRSFMRGASRRASARAGTPSPAPTRRRGP